MFSLIAALVSYRRQHALSARVSVPSVRADRAVANDRVATADLARAA
ncbi:hypothetical protein LPN01_09945 [Sphingomonas sp. A2-49]|nr:hypothetical protein [Sphingomonas sp. A2-49]MCU6454398.1 hypothetical protein [Sphingomonas sp. A2-49]